MIRTVSVAVFALMALVASGVQGSAADKAVQVRSRPVVVADAADCIYFVRQTQSWYNRCDSMPYYRLTPSHFEQPWFYIAR
jgi:hypothetical protein